MKEHEHTNKCNAKKFNDTTERASKQAYLYVNITGLKQVAKMIKRHVWTRLGQNAEVSTNYFSILFIDLFFYNCISNAQYLGKKKKTEIRFNESNLNKQTWH